MIIIISVLSFIIYRLLNRLSFFEDFYEDVFTNFRPAAALAKEILNSNMYSNEPMVVSFVESLKDLDHYLNQLNDEYSLTINDEIVDG